MLRDGTKIAQTGEHKQMPSNDLQMQIRIRNTYAHTMRDPWSRKEKEQNDQSHSCCFKTQCKHWYLEELLCKSNEVTSNQERNIRMEKVLKKRCPHIQRKSPRPQPNENENQMWAGRNREACSKAAREHPSPRTQWRVRDRKVAAKTEVPVKREERMRSHGTDVTPVRWAAFSPPAGRIKLLLANWGYEAGGSEARLGGCYCLWRIRTHRLLQAMLEAKTS